MLGRAATDAYVEVDKPVFPGAGAVLPRRLWADADLVPARVHSALARRDAVITEADASDDGVLFGIDGHPSTAGVVAKRARKGLSFLGDVSADVAAYSWDTGLGPAIPAGGVSGADAGSYGIAVEHVRASDSRLELVPDTAIKLDPRLGSVLVDKRFAPPLFVTFFAYVGRSGVHAPELPPEDAGVSHGDAHGPSYGVHQGVTEGLHKGDVIGNLKGYVSSLENHRVIKGTVIGELHGHVDGSMQGEMTGTFTGPAFVDGGEIARIESLAVGRTTHSSARFVVQAAEKQILMQDLSGQEGFLELRDGEMFFSSPLSAVAANIGPLRCTELECTYLKPLLGIKNHFAGIREVGAMSGVSDAEVERGLYFGDHRFNGQEGEFRIVRETNSDGVVELVVQTVVDGVWATIRPVGALTATSIGVVSPIEARPAVERYPRPVLAVGELLGNVTIPVSGTFVRGEVGGVIVTNEGDLANTLIFQDDANVDARVLFVDIETAPAPARRVWRGELVLKRGTLMEYGSAPLGNLDALAITSAVAERERAFELSFEDAPRHFRHAIRFSNDAYAPDDGIFAYDAGTSAYIASASRGPTTIVVKPTGIQFAEAALLQLNTRLLEPLAPLGLDISDAQVGATLTVLLDGYQLINTTLVSTRSTHSLGSLFTAFRQLPRRVACRVEHPQAVTAYLEADVHCGLRVEAYTNDLQTYTRALPFSWSQIPNAEDVVVTFTDADSANAQIIKIPLELLPPGGNVTVETQFRSGDYGEDTASYAFATDATYLTMTYPPRRGAIGVRISSTVVA